MFIEREELATAISEYTLGQIEADDVAIRSAILMAMQEAASYLNAKYDCAKIFNATGDNRNILLVEHCKSLAVWYICRISNAGIVFDKAKIYYDNAVDWLKQVAGVGESGKTISPGLPVKREENGAVKTTLRLGSNPKFSHSF